MAPMAECHMAGYVSAEGAAVGPCNRGSEAPRPIAPPPPPRTPPSTHPGILTRRGFLLYKFSSSVSPKPHPRLIDVNEPATNTKQIKQIIKIQSKQRECVFFLRPPVDGNVIHAQ